MSEENNQAVEEIQKEIEEVKKKTDDFEIEIAEDPKPEEPKVEEKKEPKVEEKKDDAEYGRKVQHRIRKLIDQKKEAELQAKESKDQLDSLQARLDRLEKGSETKAKDDFNQKYELTKRALHKAVEEGDTDAQVNFQEQLADMRAAIRINDLQQQMKQQQAVSPTVGRAQQVATNPTPQKAMNWWQQNNWFNAEGFERETAAARAIDVQLDLEGHDKNGDEYYNLLNNRLRNMFPELITDNTSIAESKPVAKSSKVVAPTAGGTAYKSNRVRMTKDQLRMARELGINDEAGLKKYESEIKKSQRS